MPSFSGSSNAATGKSWFTSRARKRLEALHLFRLRAKAGRSESTPHRRQLSRQYSLKSITSDTTPWQERHQYAMAHCLTNLATHLTHQHQGPCWMGCMWRRITQTPQLGNCLRKLWQFVAGSQRTQCLYASLLLSGNNTEKLSMRKRHCLSQEYTLGTTQWAAGPKLSRITMQLG